METPFTTEEFFSVFVNYNTSVFPLQLIFLVMGVIAIILLHPKKRLASYLISGFLGVLWLWIGIVYHINFFTTINNAAYIFGGLSMVQGVLFLIAIFRKKLQYSFENTTQKYMGYLFILFGLVIYPIISYFDRESFATTISLGLPCPTTIFTFGFLMLTNNRFPKYLLIIPTLWVVIGTFAAVNFGVYQDYVMLIAAIMANLYLIKRKKYK